MTRRPLTQIISGSTPLHRRGDPVARAAMAECGDDLATEVVEFGEVDLPFLTDATPPMDATPRDTAAERWPEKDQITNTADDLPDDMACLGATTLRAGRDAAELAAA
jgi:hypothetical protein